MDYTTQDFADIRYRSAIWLSDLTEEATPERLFEFCQWLEQSAAHRGILLQIFEAMAGIRSPGCAACASTHRAKRFGRNDANGLPDIARWNALVARRRRILRKRGSLRIRLHLLWSDVLDVLAHPKWRWGRKAALRAVVSAGVKS